MFRTGRWSVNPPVMRRRELAARLLAGDEDLRKTGLLIWADGKMSQNDLRSRIVVLSVRPYRQGTRRGHHCRDDCSKVLSAK